MRERVCRSGTTVWTVFRTSAYGRNVLMPFKRVDGGSVVGMEMVAVVRRMRGEFCCTVDESRRPHFIVLGIVLLSMRS